MKSTQTNLSTWTVNGFGTLCMQKDPLIYKPDQVTDDVVEYYKKPTAKFRVPKWLKEFFNPENFEW